MTLIVENTKNISCRNLPRLNIFTDSVTSLENYYFRMEFLFDMV